MGQSVLKHPRAVLSRLRRDYQLDDGADILAFFEGTLHASVSTVCA